MQFDNIFFFSTTWKLGSDTGPTYSRKMYTSPFFRANNVYPVSYAHHVWPPHAELLDFSTKKGQLSNSSQLDPMWQWTQFSIKDFQDTILSLCIRIGHGFFNLDHFPQRVRYIATSSNVIHSTRYMYKHFTWNTYSCGLFSSLNRIILGFGMLVSMLNNDMRLL